MLNRGVKQTNGIITALDIIKFPYTIGSCEKIAVMADGGILCHQCVKENLRLIATAYYDHGDQWAIERANIAESYNGPLYCTNCGRLINGED